jgi:uncharacterized tellurite resistance protein B-like protein
MFWNKEKQQNEEFKDIEIAVCMLLIHAAKTDNHFDEIEKRIIKESLFELGLKDKEYIDRLYNYSENKEKDSVEILNMTKEIKKLKYEHRLEIIEMMLKVIYSDDELCQFEDRLIRKVAGLIYIENKDLGEIKLRVKK